MVAFLSKGVQKKLALLIIFCAFLYIPEVPSQDVRTVETVVGKVSVRHSRGSYYLSIDGKNMKCAHDFFALSSKCPNVALQSSLSGLFCQARLVRVQSKFLVFQDLMVSLTCDGRELRDFSEENLTAYRGYYRNSLQKTAGIPVGIFLIFFYIFFLREKKSV